MSDGTENLLPPALSGRFTVEGPLPERGGEAHLYLVAEGGERRVLKLFRDGQAPPARLREFIADAARDVPHLVTTLEIGRAGERHYELQEHPELGPLDVGSPWPPEELRNAIGQLVMALEGLHRHGIAHGRLDPRTVLTRRRPPLDLAVADFGLVPDAVPAGDWRALGLIVLALATGRGDAEPADIADHRLRVLCQGLTRERAERRWSGGEARAWLAGRDPMPSVGSLPRAAPVPGGGFRTGRPVFADAPGMAAAIAADWAVAEATLASLAAPELTEALARMLPGSDAAGYAAVMRDAPSPTVGLVRLIRALDPAHGAVCRGHPLDGDHVATIARIAVEPGHREHHEAWRLVNSLTRPELTGELAAMPGGHRLRITAHNWRRHRGRWHERHASAGTEPLAWLLYLAADREEATESIGRLLAGAPSADWLTRLATSDDPVDRVAALWRLAEARRGGL